MEERTESPSSAKVRDLIFAYERNWSTVEPLDDPQGRPRAKSIGNVLSYKHFRQPNLEFYSIVDIEKELVKIEAHLNYYEVYEKETHVAFQEQLFNVLTSIVSIDPEDHEGAIQMKKKLIMETQKLASNLNSRLPYDRSHSYKGVRRTYSTLVRKEEAVVSTTSQKSQAHRAILSSHNSALNGGFKSEESLSSTKDSIDLSLRYEDSSSIDLNQLEEKSQCITPPPQKKITEDVNSTPVPSVSKLKQFFSFRRETKPEVKVTSASYSGISRSQSLNIKTTKYTVVKRNKNGEANMKEKAISENDEDLETYKEELNSSTLSEDLSSTQSTNKNMHPDSSDNNVYIEPVKEIEEYREGVNETIHNVSVSKLKGLFEQNRNETNEGLGLLTQKQNEFKSDFNIPFTAMNLGAYRLKRTISGSYMNFTGLLRNVDINKKGDLSKSKSLTDLKSSSFGYRESDINIDDDLSKEIDDNDDLERVSIDVGKESREINNNSIKNEHSEITKETINGEEVVQNTTETLSIHGSVKELKHTFENLSTTSIEENNDDIKHVLHRTIEPINSGAAGVEEPLLKIPVQLRVGITNFSHDQNIVEQSKITKETINREKVVQNTNETSALYGTVKELKHTFENLSTPTIEENNDDIKRVLHRTIESINSGAAGVEEPLLKIPVQLRVGPTNVSHSQNIDEQSEITKETINREEEEENTTATSASYGTVKGLKHTFENFSTTAIEENNDDIKHVLHRTIQPIYSGAAGVEEPLLKIPVQLRVGPTNVSHSQNIGEQSEITKETINREEVVQNTTETSASHGTVKGLKHTFENFSTTTMEENNNDIKHVLHRTIEPINNGAAGVEKPLLKIPVQLRVGTTNVSYSQNMGEQSEITKETINREEVVQNTTETSALHGTVKGLKHTFENLSTTTIEENNDDIKHVLHRTIEPINSGAAGVEEPLLKIPVQLRVGPTNVSHSQNIGEQSEITEEMINREVIQNSTEISASQGTVKELKHTFENLGTTTIEENNDDIKHVLHRTNSSVAGVEEPLLKIPVQLRVGPTDVSHSQNISEQSEITDETIREEVVQNTTETSASHGTVKELKNTFENYVSTTTLEENNDDIKHVFHRTNSGTAGVEEPLPKITVQLRVVPTNVSDSQNKGEQTEKSDKVLVNNQENRVQEQKETLLKIPVQLRIGATNREENLSSTTGPVEENDDIKHVLHRTIDPIPSNGIEEPVLKVPVQLRVGYTKFTESETTVEKNSHNGDVRITADIGKHERVPMVDVASYTNGSSEKVADVENIRITTDINKHKKLPIVDATLYSNESEKIMHVGGIRISSNIDEQEKVSVADLTGTEKLTQAEDIRITTDIDKHERVPIVDVTLYSNETDETSRSENATMDRARIEERTHSFVKILESPTTFSSRISSSTVSKGQHVSSTSDMSVSFSEKKTMEHTSSTHVSTRIVSSSSSTVSSQQSGEHFIQVLKEPVSYSRLSTLSSEHSNEENAVIITEPDDDMEEETKLNLNVSQENIIEEILKETDSLENVDEEFEKMLEEYAK